MSQSGDSRIVLVNGRFEDFVGLLPEPMAPTDDEASRTCHKGTGVEAAGLPVHPFEAARYLLEPSLRLAVHRSCETCPNVSVRREVAARIALRRWAGRRVRGPRRGSGAILGRLTQIGVPERERLTLEPELGKVPSPTSVGSVERAATLELSEGKVAPGIGRYPQVGSGAYLAHPSLVRWAAELSAPSGGSDTRRDCLGENCRWKPTRKRSLPGALIRRHCAGAGDHRWRQELDARSHGGRKSYGCAGKKAILLDATGEYHTLATGVGARVPWRRDWSEA